MVHFLPKTGARVPCFCFRTSPRFPVCQANEVIETIQHRHFTTTAHGGASSNTFSRWIGAVYGQLGAGLSYDYWDSVGKFSLFRRSMSTMKTKVDRRKRDLARREFQLLRKKTKLMKATMSPEERFSWRLKKANRKKAILLQRLKKYELEEDPEPVHDPELITPEQLHALKKIGYKNRNYVPVGRRGVYGGVVQNMHMHWKFHETVQVDCHIFKRDDIRSIARELAILSGGIVIDIHQGTTIIMYRGRNYKQPKTEMIPPNTLTKRKALFKSKILQALDGLNTNIRNIESELQMIQRKQKENVSKSNAVETTEAAKQMTEVAKEKAGTGLLQDTYINVSTDEDSEDDDGIFSWDSDSLDEDELSEDENMDLPKRNLEEEEKDTMSWTHENNSKDGGKKKAQTAKELVQAEQKLFKEGQNRTIKMRKGFDLIEDETDDTADGTTNDRNEKNTVARRHRQPRNKKIARFLNDFNKNNEDEEGDKFETDFSEDNEFGSDFLDLDDSEDSEDDTDFNDLANQSNDTKGKTL